MIKTSNIPESALPSELEKENAIRVEYKTNLLAPALGPIQRSNMLDGYLARTRALVATIAQIDDLALAVASSVQLLPKKNDPEWSGRSKRIRTGEKYSEQFVTPLRNYATRLREQAELSSETLADKSARVSGRGTARDIDSNITRLASLSRQSEDLSVTREVADIIEKIATPNAVKHDLFRAGIFKNDETIVDRKVLKLDQKGRAKAILTALARETEPSLFSSYLTKLALTLTVSGTSLSYIEDLLKTDSVFEGLWTGHIQPNPNLGVVVPFDPELDSNREWGIQRFEEMRLALGTPFFRGPVAAHSVAPKSKLTLTESVSLETELAALSVESRTSTAFFSDTAISSSQFQNRLENLSEFGITNANAFSSTSTLFESLNEVRRSAIQQVAHSISETNESRVLHRTSRRMTQSSELVTEGKDAKLATTELEFQIVTPGKATVRLVDVGLLWTPFVNEPFYDLRQAVKNHRTQVEDEYRQQNYLPVPVMPPLKPKVVKEHLHPIRMTLSKKSSYLRDEANFDIDVSDILYGEAQINVHSISIEKISFFGPSPGLSGDGWEMDLQPSYSELVRISLTYNRLKGRLIVSYPLIIDQPSPVGCTLILKIPVYVYEEESAAALRQYEASKKEEKSQLQSIEARAKQYGQLKAQEMIRQLEASYDLKQEVFRQVLDKIFSGAFIGSLAVSGESLSSMMTYYEYLIASCINWSESSMVLSSASLQTLIYPDLPPDHFLNSPSARLFLPIKRSAEKSFFEILAQIDDKILSPGTDFYYTAKRIRDSVENYRSEIERRRSLDPSQLVLDNFDTEIVIGRHLEAVLSHFEFSKSE